MQSNNTLQKLIISAGGTGGHLFPAQSLALKILEKKANVQIAFLGGKLSQNHFFQKNDFIYQDIVTAPLVTKNLYHFFKNIYKNCIGLRQSLHFIKQFQPDLIIGFGSFYTFPILLAAYLKKIPFILHEQNTYPGKVNQLFAKKALFTGITFPETEKFLKGVKKQVVFPIKKHSEITVQEARKYYGLDSGTITILVFGGSQGANFINDAWCCTAQLLKQHAIPIQWIHFIGNKENEEPYQEKYTKTGLNFCLKKFETQMPVAWRAADFAITRAGASTIAELIHFEVPCLLIPYRYASDDHQTANGKFVANQIKGGMILQEEEVSPQKLLEIIKKLMTSDQLTTFKNALINFKIKNPKCHFDDLILNLFKPNKI